MKTKDYLNLIAHERAPKYDGGRPNLRLQCKDGFSISVQASLMHYAFDQLRTSSYKRDFDDEPVYPFTHFELGFPSEKVDLFDYDDDVAGYVSFKKVKKLLDSHGGVVGWVE